MKTKLKKLPPLLFVTLLAVFLIASPDTASKNVENALEMCALRLIPSLFPFFVLSSIFNGLGVSRTLSRMFSKLFRLVFGVSGSGALPLFLGFLGGYPVGVKTVCSQYENGEISKAEAERLLLFCGNTGPAFIIGAAGAGIFGSVRAGLILYATHIAAALVFGIICRMCFGKIPETHTVQNGTASENFAQIFTSSVTDALTASLNVTAFVLLFSVISGLLDFLGVTDALCALVSLSGADPVRAKAVITGFLEISSGIEALKAFSQNTRFALPAAAFILAWGGVSVHCQALSFISPARLRVRGYIAAKLFHGVLAAVMVSLLTGINAVAPTFAFTGHTSVKAFLFDYLGLFFSVSCGIASIVLHFIARYRRRS